MPLQVGMEEGPRSKAVRISGLQYCLYSYEKTSLITLLLDLVYHCCVYSEELLMMDRGTVRNM